VSPDELSRRMRTTFEASLPNEEDIVRRVSAGREARTRARRTSGAARSNDAFFAQWRELASRPRLAALGLALAAAAAFSFWSLSEDPAVRIGPSLAKDLESGYPRVPLALPSSPEADDAWLLREDATREDAARGEPIPALPAREALSPPKRAAEKLEAAMLETPPPGIDDTARWARVTEAMRKRDWVAAQTALRPLVESQDAETRDGARLVQIRLELGASEGSAVDQRWLADLRVLAAQGSTSSIRASARRLLETLEGDTPAAADDAPPGTSEKE
jgi:hypothetical protein